MASKNVFGSISKAAAFGAPKADARNAAGGLAYAQGPRAALAAYAVVGTFGDGFYASAETQLDRVVEMCAALQATGEDGIRFIAQTALYSREHGHMKDVPAFLLGYLFKACGPHGVQLGKAIFDRVCDNGRMLRNFVQIVRSGVFGSKGFGTAAKTCIQTWFRERDGEKLFWQSVGNSPSLGDCLALAHPRPRNLEANAVYKWLRGKDLNEEDQAKMPDPYKAFTAMQKLEVAGDQDWLPKGVPFEMLAGANLKPGQWKALAKQATWQQTRMNLNTFARHGVLQDPKMVELLAAKLQDENAIAKARVFPYQLLAAYLNATPDVPAPLTNALQFAMERATANVPIMGGRGVICPDVSGSMSSAVTGNRGTATSKVRCIDVAGLVSASVLRRNAEATVIPFEGAVVDLRRVAGGKLNPLDSVMTNAQKLASIGGGSTNCAAPLELLNANNIRVDWLWMVSDSESWVGLGYYGRTNMTTEWLRLKARCPNAKLVLHDIQAGGTTQIPPGHKDTLFVAGFSDRVFDVVANFVNGGPGDLADVIAKIAI